MAARRRAAVGFKVHTGWAAVVAVGGPGPEVLAKARVQVAWTFEEGAVFHVGQKLPIEEARALVSEAEARFVKQARAELAAFAGNLDAQVVAAAVVWGGPKPLPPLETILKAHPLVHAAEAELYRRVFAEAGEAVLGVTPQRPPGSELLARAASALRLTEATLAERLAVMGKASGRPWTVDQREAALAAWLALATVR
jgi:hypothetical protein